MLLADGTAWVLGDAPGASTTAAGLTLVGTAGSVRSSATDARYVLVRGSSLVREGSQVLSADAAEGVLEAEVQTQAGKVDIQAAYVTRARVFAPGATSATWNGAAVTLSADSADSRYVFIPGLGTPAIDAGVPPPTSFDAGVTPDAGGTWNAGPLSGPRPVVAGGAAGGGGPAPGVRGNCSATGNEPWILSALTLLGLVGARRHRKPGKLRQ